MKSNMSLNDYKQKVKNSLIKIYNCPNVEADRLMKVYDEDFQEMLKVFKWNPVTMALAMQIGF